MENKCVLDKMNACDDRYLELFCIKGREWGLYVFQDRQLPELPAHNYIRIPEHIPAGRLRGLCDVARNTANATGRSYLRIELSHPLHFNSAVSEQWGRYHLSGDTAIDHIPDGEFSFIAVDCADNAKAYIEFEADDTENEQFARRRAERFSRVYLEDNGLTGWLCIRGGKVIGCGEVFVCEGAAKIANVSVAAGEDAVAIKSALLAHLARQGRKQGAELVYYYSVDDVPGFIKAGEGYALNWAF